MSSVCPTCGSQTAAGRLRGLCSHCLATSLLDTEDEAAPMLVAGHELVGEIARGGMGIVYRARQLHPEREVALKMLLPQGATPAQRERFLLEARALASLDHPGLLPVYQSGESSGVPFFTMKLARGGSLTERRVSLSKQWRRIAGLIADLAEAVHFAHGHGVLHRDLKPANVLFDADSTEDGERVYVADFGLAKVAQEVSDLTQSVAMLGTPHYMSPETAERGAAAATTASDVYSLGVMLYELLAQRRPFEAETTPKLMREIVEKEPPSIPHCPRDLQVIARKAMAKQPSARYGSARSLAEDLRRWLAGQPIKAHPASVSERLWAWARRQPALAGVTALFVVSLIAGAMVLLGKNRALTRGLAEAQLARAAALQQSGDSRRRDEALELLNAAVRDGADRNAAREYAVTLLATPAWKEESRVPWRPGAWVAPAPDLSLFAEVHGGALRLRPLLSSGVEEEITCPSPPTNMAGVLTRPQRIMVRLEGGLFRLYDTERKAWGREWQDIARVLISQDGRWLASAKRGSSEVTVEDMQGGEALRTVTSSHAEPRPLAITADGRRLAVAGASNARVEAFEVSSGKTLATVTQPWRHQHPVKAAWRPDGAALAIATDGTEVFLWQIEAPKIWQRRLRGHNMEILSVAWHPGGEWIATSSFDNTVRLWEVSSGRELLRLPMHASLVRFSQDGRVLLCLDSLHNEFAAGAFTPPEVVRQVELIHNDPDSALQRGPFGLALTSDGNTAVVAGDGAWVIDARNGSIVTRLFNGYCHDALIAADSTLYLINPENPCRALKSNLLPGSDGSHAVSTPLSLVEKQGLIRLSWSPQKQWLTASTASSVSVFQVNGNVRAVREFSTDGTSINVAVISPDGRWIAAGTEGSNITGIPSFIFDTTVAETKPAARLPLTGYVQAVFSPDSRTLYTTCPRGLSAWDAGTWKQRWNHPSPTEHSDFKHIAMSGDGRLIAATVFPYGIRLFGAAGGESLATIDHPDRRGLDYIALDKTGRRLVANGVGHVVQIWDLELLRKKLGEKDLDWQEPH